ncbi:hypothetical protein, partial [Pseudomonas sp. FW306-02-H05-AA]|uniref:hypothetical protein n=1 Tax=Pseudomonas sp. FW306-02-H05-AA TaxID=2070657 RepID=UPI000CBDB2D0
ALDIDTRIRFYHLRGNISIAKDLPLQATTDYLHAAAISKDDTSVNVYLQKAFNASQKIFNSDAKADVETLEKLLDEFGKNNSTGLT